MATERLRVLHRVAKKFAGTRVTRGLNVSRGQIHGRITGVLRGAKFEDHARLTIHTERTKVIVLSEARSSV